MSIGRDVRFLGAPIVTLADDSLIVVGERAVLISRSDMTALGVNHPTILRTLEPGARLEIGADVGVSGATICAAHAVRIDDECLIGANAMIVDTNFHAIDPDSRRYASPPSPQVTDAVSIGRNVFIGANAIVLPGTVIGDHAVVGAGAVVKGDVPAGTTVAGNPARPLNET